MRLLTPIRACQRGRSRMGVLDPPYLEIPLPPHWAPHSFGETREDPISRHLQSLSASSSYALREAHTRPSPGYVPPDVRHPHITDILGSPSRSLSYRRGRCIYKSAPSCSPLYSQPQYGPAADKRSTALAPHSIKPKRANPFGAPPASPPLQHPRPQQVYGLLEPHFSKLRCADNNSASRVTARSVSICASSH